MLQKLLLVCCLFIVVFTSCKKELTTQQAAINSSNTDGTQSGAFSSLPGVADTTSGWYGTYSGLFKPYPIVGDSEFVRNGVAQLPYLDRQFSFSTISYDIPSQYSISGDSISFEAKVKNTTEIGFSDYDVLLQLTGEQHNAEVHFVADPDYLSYTYYTIGDMTYPSLSGLVHYFGSFQTIKLAQKNYYTAVYINNKLVYKFKYGIKNSIGKLKTLNITFKGYGMCTQTGLRNSYNSKPILSEDFNTNGKSNTIYY